MADVRNQKVLKHLENLGDTCKKPRPVLHWAYFKTAAYRRAYIGELRELGYKINYESHRKHGKRPFCVCFSKAQLVDQDSIDETYAELEELAEGCNGEYDGWETEVIRSVH